jgi:glycine oxidase
VIEEGVLVVGAGIAGAAVALELRDRGRKVLVLEARRDRDAPPERVATGASAGMLAPQYEISDDEALIRLAVASRERHPAFVRHVEQLAGVELGLRMGGMLVAAFSDEARREMETDAARHRALGLSAEVIAPKDALRLQPGLSPEAAAWMWLPDEGRLDTQRLAAALPAALEAAGAEVRYGARVLRILERGGTVWGVELDGGDVLRAGRLVLAAGAWSGRVDGLPRALPVRPVRGQMLRYAPNAAPAVSRLVARRDGAYMVPRTDGTVLAGSTMEEAGFDASVTPEGEARIRSGAASLVPAAAGLEPVERWAGLRPLSADGAPILGPDPALEGLYYATGYGRNGILLGPAAGAILAAQLAGGDSGPNWRTFSVARFDRA